ncbi:MAG: hypothetical protein PVSMB1_04230 [Gemmatimonadaceae bacterium]
MGAGGRQPVAGRVRATDSPDRRAGAVATLERRSGDVGIECVYLAFRNPAADGEHFMFGLLTATFETAQPR